MHFHLPKPLHGWREFAGEVGIIVIGVLIALGAQQLVDEWQWHQKVGRAEAAMRLELAEDDGPQAYGRALISPCLDQQLTRIHDGSGKVPSEQLRKWAGDYAPPFRTWDSEAWKVVVASDTGSHMGPDRLVAWSAPYRILPMLTDQAQREGQLVIDLRETLPAVGAPSASELQSLRRTAAQLSLLNRRFASSSQLLLTRIAANGAPVPLSMKRALLADARALYGKCVVVPDLNAPPSAMRLIANLRGGSLKK
jgi:hypothetical protein